MDTITSLKWRFASANRQAKTSRKQGEYYSTLAKEAYEKALTLEDQAQRLQELIIKAERDEMIASGKVIILKEHKGTQASSGPVPKSRRERPVAKITQEQMKALNILGGADEALKLLEKLVASSGVSK